MPLRKYESYIQATLMQIFEIAAQMSGFHCQFVQGRGPKIAQFNEFIHLNGSPGTFSL